MPACILNILKENYVIYDLKTQQVDINTESYSFDKQLLQIQMTVHFAVQPDKVIEVANTYGTLDVLQTRIQNVISEKAKVVLGLQQAATIIEKRSTLSPDVMTSAKEIENQYFIFIENIIIHDLAFNEAYEQSVEDTMIAEQELVKADFEKKIALVKAEQALEVATKEAAAILVRAEQQALAELELAQAQAQAIELIQAAWSGIDPDIRETMLKEQFYAKWDGILPQVMGGDLSVLFPLNP